jgi:hypothetical protein
VPASPPRPKATPTRRKQPKRKLQPPEGYPKLCFRAPTETEKAKAETKKARTEAEKINTEAEKARRATLTLGNSQGQRHVSRTIQRRSDGRMRTQKQRIHHQLHKEKRGNAWSPMTHRHEGTGIRRQLTIWQSHKEEGKEDTAEEEATAEEEPPFFYGRRYLHFLHRCRNEAEQG